MQTRLAFVFNEKPEKIETPANLRAPEMLEAGSSREWDHRIDLWALGCLVDTIHVRRIL